MTRIWWRMVLAVTLSTGMTVAQTAGPQAQGSAAGSAQVGDRQASGSASTRLAGSASAPAGDDRNHANASLASGTAIHAELTKPLDARKAKPGDTVDAKVTQDVKSQGQVVIRHGTRLVGHVTQAQARAKGDSSTMLGIVFDQAEPKGGPAIPLHTVIQAVAAAQSSTTAMADDEGLGVPSPGMPAMGNAPGATPGRGGLAPAVGSTVGAAGSTLGNVGGATGSTLGTTANAAGSAAGNVAGGSAHAATDLSGRLAGTTRGVTGLPGVTLSATGASAGTGSVMTSSDKNLHLDSGTHLLLQATSE